MKIYRIWKPAYRPFIMGGNVNAPIFFKVVPNKIENLGEGIDVGIVNYNGKCAVFELISGGVVGESIDEVKADFKRAKREILLNQIDKATIEGENADRVTMEQFFT